MRKTLLKSCVLATSLTLAACGGGSSGGGGVSSSLLITDSPADDLLAFHATVEEVRLVYDDARLTNNLVNGNLDLELLGLDGVFEWLASRPLPNGTFSGLQVTFVAGSYAAVSNDGTPVTVDAASDVWNVDFDAPVIVDGDYHRIVLDLDVRDSLTGDVSAPPLTFNAAGDASADDSVVATIDEIKGILRSFDPVEETLVLDAFADDDLSVELGRVTVALDSSTLVVDEDDFIFLVRADFFTFLTGGETLLEVHGQIGTDGVIEATKVQIEDQSGGGTLVAEVEIEGVVVDATPTSFSLLIRDIEKGAALAAPILAALPDPSTIEVNYDGDTTFYMDDNTLLAGDIEDFLEIGSEVEAEFALFLSDPFTATRVELDGGGPEFEATVVDVAGLPDSIVVNIDGDELVVTSGVVASDTTDVTIDLTAGGSLLLDVEGEPSLTSDVLMNDFEIEIQGVVSGTPSAPTVELTELEIRPGVLEGASVSQADAPSSSFQTSGGSIDGSFGAENSPGPFNVTIDPNCVFEGDVSSATAFFDLFDGATLQVSVDVTGIGTDAGAITAYEIEVEVSPVTPQ